ncbi:MAG TPA: hypothetical protein VF662_14895 [Allosphingosinicella sp.]|jgi:hypothetical protein
MKMRGAPAIVAFAFAGVANAQSVTLTEDSGRPLLVGDAAGIAEGLNPSAIAPAVVVAEFRRLCLPDPGAAAQRVSGSPLQLVSSDAQFPAAGKNQQGLVTQWRGPSAILSIWSGDHSGLKGRPIAITSRGYSTTGPYGPFKAEGVQCNLVVALTDFSAVQGLTEALTTALGQPGKLVAKKSFADGYWNVGDAGRPIRINFTAPSVRGAPQPVHLSAQILTKGNKR